MLGPSLHALKREAVEKGLKDDYIKELARRTTALLNCKVPVVHTLMHLAVLSGSPWQQLHDCVSRSLDPYITFEIRKRSGGNRRICVPLPFLKRTQRWIDQNILRSPGALALVHESSMAYGSDCSAHKNAAKHAGAAWIVKVDIKDFFESISERQVYHTYRELGYPALLAFELTRLSTRYFHNSSSDRPQLRQKRWRWTAAHAKGTAPYLKSKLVGHLPQGAPTSPMLANLVVRRMDADINALAVDIGATYTRYADDMVLSLSAGTRNEATLLLQRVVNIVTRYGFRINRKKTHVRGPGARKVVTGLVVNDSRPRLPRSLKDEIELALYHIEKHGLMSHMERMKSSDPIGYLSHLKGLLLYARQVEPEFADAALASLRAILAPYSEFLEVFRTFRPPTDNGYMFS